MPRKMKEDRGLMRGSINLVDGDKCTCHVRVGKRRLRALVDSGASVSIIAKHVLSRDDKILPASVDLRTVSGQSLSVLGQIRLKMKIGHSVISHSFHIVNGINNSMILGMDFICQNNVVLDFNKTGHFMKIGHSRVPLTSSEIIKSIVRLTKDIKLPPNTGCITTAACKKAILEEGQTTGLLTEIESGFISREPGLIVVDSLAQIEHGRRVPISIINSTGKTLSLRRGNVVARIQGIEKISQLDITDCNTAMSSATSEQTGGEHTVTDIESLLKLNQDLFAESDLELKRTNVLEMNIDTKDDTPIALRPYRIPLGKQKIVDEQIDKLLQAGIISPSRSPYAAPIVLVNKKDGSQRMCVDYRKLNENTIPYRWPLPHIDDVLAKLSQSKYYSALDLRAGFHQLPIKESDIHKTAFTSHRGLFEYNCMSFGLRNAPAFFSELMHKVLGDLPFAMCYIDDVIVFSKSEAEHLEHLAIVMDRLRKANLRLKRSKCEFFKDKLRYLGFLVSREGIAPDPEKVAAIQKIATPKCVKDVRALIGCCNYYRKCIPNYSKIACPLLDLTRKFAKFDWSESCQKSFETLKQALCQAPVLIFPDMSKEFLLYCDASQECIGGYLAQEVDGMEKPIHYLSQRLSHTQKRWPILQKEAFAIYTCMEKLKHYLHGAKVTIKTDHKPLIYMFDSQISNDQVARWALTISQMAPNIDYIKGRDNVPADFLSRVNHMSNDETAEKPGCESNPQGHIAVINTNYVDPRLIRLQRREVERARVEEGLQLPDAKFDNMESLQDEDPEIVTVKKAALNNEHSVRKNYIVKDNLLYFVSSTGDKLKLVVPQSLKSVILKQSHDEMAHIGCEKTHSIIKSNYHWRGLFRDVVHYVTNCVTCQTRSVKKNKAPLQIPEPVLNNNEKVAIDTVGPLPLSANQNKYIITLVDTYSGWPEAYAVPDKSASTVARILLQEYIPRHSCMLTLLSDNGTEFVNEIVDHICKELKICRIKTSIFHPQGNSKVERFHRILGDMISKQLNSKNDSCWEDCIPHALHAYRVSDHASNGFSPFFLHYARDPTLPLDTILLPRRKYLGEEQHRIALERQHEAFKTVQHRVRQNKIKQKMNYDKNAVNIEYEPGDAVYLYNNYKNSKFDKKWLPYYRILKKTAPHNYVVQSVIDNKVVRVHSNLLRKAELSWDSNRIKIHQKRRLRNTNYVVTPSDSESDDSQSDNAIPGSRLVDRSGSVESHPNTDDSSDDNIPLAALQGRNMHNGSQALDPDSMQVQVSDSGSEAEQITNEIDRDDADVIMQTASAKRALDADEVHSSPKRHKVKALLQLISDIM